MPQVLIYSDIQRKTESAVMAKDTKNRDRRERGVELLRCRGVHCAQLMPVRTSRFRKAEEPSASISNFCAARINLLFSFLLLLLRILDIE